jgi:hypothetical protein
MKIKQITSQNRRDFYAIYKCEFCGHEETGSGYDDRNFHDNVVPDKECTSCKKSTNSEGGTPDSRPTRYPENKIV